jgi:acylphosphatase
MQENCKKVMNEMSSGSGELAGAHLIVSGLVQGVGFRWWVMRKAQEYGLKGYVRNLYDGDVELEVEGLLVMIVDFVKEVKVGPRYASVTEAKVQWGEYQGRYKGFDIKF